MPRFSAADGTPLHYTDEGRGPAVLALSGLTRNGSDFDYVAPHLDRRLIRLDYRGRGRSDWADPATYTIPQEAQDALALLDHLGVARAGVLGTSRGGLIAMVLAATARDRLSGVGLVDIGPDLAPEGLAAIQGYIGRNPGVATRAEAVAARAALMQGFDGVPASRWAEEVDKHYLDGPNGLTINYDPRLAEAFAAASAQPPVDLWPLFDAMAGLPLALVRGANSDLLSAETAAEMRRRRPDMLFADVPGRGHVPFLDEPEALEILRAWVGRL
ncbi:alpha/beta hydrolase [Rhodobacteraceae bacterium CCMM004]|nr:alpha/beta hydrolase [Rhodobacteraceae bacterium CCMM004]